MCLYTEYRLNKKYLRNQKNGGNPPVLLDNRVKYVPIACGQCIEFNENFIDDISAQGQDLINVIDDLTDSFTIYARAYFEFVAFGACYTYRDVVGTQLIKRVVSIRDAFPVPNDVYIS